MRALRIRPIRFQAAILALGVTGCAAVPAARPDHPQAEFGAMATAVMVAHGDFDADDHRRALATGNPNEICVGPVSKRTAAAIEAMVAVGSSERQPLVNEGPVGMIVLHRADGSGTGAWREGGMDRAGQVHVLTVSQATLMDGLIRRALVEASCTDVGPLERWYADHPTLRLP